MVLFAIGGTVIPRIVEVANIIEKVKSASIEEERNSNGMNGRVSPSLVEESSCFVEPFKIVEVRLGSPETKVADFKVGPIVGADPCILNALLRVVAQEVITWILGEVLGMLGEELLRLGPQCRHSLFVLVERHGEAISLVVHLHKDERIVVEIAIELDTWLDTPIVVQIEREVVAEEESRLVSAHVAVAFR